MKNVLKLNISKIMNEDHYNSYLKGASRDSSASVLTPVTLFGVVIPWTSFMPDGRTSHFKLACAGGAEFFIVADEEMLQVLSQYSWENVKVKGLLNVSNMTLLPQWIYPKGPTGEQNSVIEMATWRGREFIQKMTKNVTDLVLVPTFVCSTMS